MRLFKSNKSQASLPISQEPRSAHNSPGDSPIHSPAYPPPPASYYSGLPQHESAPDNHFEPQRFQISTEAHSHPAHLPTRSFSQRAPSNAYQARPTVNVVAPVQPSDEDTIHEESYPPFTISAPSQPNRFQKDDRKSKRTIFGLHSSTTKENPSNFQTPKGLGRSISVRRPPGQDQIRYPSIQTSNTTYLNKSQEQLQVASESTDLPSVDNKSPSQEQYYRQPKTYDSNHIQTVPSQPPQYPEDPSSYNQQQTQYRAFQPSAQPPPQQNNGKTYLPYHPHSEPDQSSLKASDPYLDRPSSQQSIGPPSPIALSQPTLDPRSGTAQTRYSAHSLNVPPQQQVEMVGRDGANSGLRSSQMVPQHGQSMDAGHGSYGQHPSGPPPVTRQLSQQPSNLTDHGRSTPPPTKNREDSATADYQALLQRHEELQAKYSKVKKYYFEKDSQVTQLQNMVANQRLSMSKTSLDDNEYAARFIRLDGAINNLSFNIRKNWKGVPPWLQNVCNKDAHTVGTKEMTSIGRACITRWVVDEILDRYFHPALEPALSSQLKIIEKNIRRSGAGQNLSDEQRDDLTTKLTSWRLTTLEGLQESLTSPQANDYRNQLIAGLVDKLTTSLQLNLSDTPQPGLETGVLGIIELAIGIATNLPVESRDVYVEYFMPGALINDSYMKMETGLAPLTNPANAEFADQADGASMTSASSLNDNGSVENDRDGGGKATPTPGSAVPRSDVMPQGLNLKVGEKKKGLFGLVNKKPAPSDNLPGRLPSNSTSATMTAKEAKERESLEKAEREKTIRFAAFLAVEVRGKGKDGSNVLMKAPCFGY